MSYYEEYTRQREEQERAQLEGRVVPHHGDQQSGPPSVEDIQQLRQEAGRLRQVAEGISDETWDLLVSMGGEEGARPPQQYGQYPPQYPPNYAPYPPNDQPPQAQGGGADRTRLLIGGLFGGSIAAAAAAYLTGNLFPETKNVTPILPTTVPTPDAKPVSKAATAPAPAPAPAGDRKKEIDDLFKADTTTKEVTAAAPQATVAAPPANQPPRAAPKPALADTSLGQDRDLESVFSRNLKWKENQVAQNPEFFSRFANGQTPQMLWIGCSDSRVPPNALMGVDVGDVFVTRNIANVVSSLDSSSSSVMQYAVDDLKVPHIIVCGHYKCGGVKAALATLNNPLPAPLAGWIRNIQDVMRLHQAELDAIADFDKKWARLVELNTIEQCLNVYTSGTVRRAHAASKKNGDEWSRPRVHAFVYDPIGGNLKNLDDELAKVIKQQKLEV
jgi:carbonic anhydrase